MPYLTPRSSSPSDCADNAAAHRPCLPAKSPHPEQPSRRSCQARLWLCLLISSLRTYPALGRRMPQSEFPKGLSQSQLLESLLLMQDKCLKDMDSLLCTSRLNAIQ